MNNTPPNFVTTDRLPLPVHFIELYDYDGSAMFWTTSPVDEKELQECVEKLKAEMNAWCENMDEILDEATNSMIPNPNYNASLPRPRQVDEVLFEKFGMARLKPHLSAPYP